MCILRISYNSIDYQRALRRYFMFTDMKIAQTSNNINRTWLLRRMIARVIPSCSLSTMLWSINCNSDEYLTTIQCDGVFVAMRVLYVICTVRCLLSPAIEEHTLERVLECFAEVTIEVGVDQWIQHRVEIADPEEYGHQHIRAFAWSTAQRRNHIPARQETRNRKIK